MSDSNVQNYVLGRGKIYFDKFAAGTKTLTGERYFGSTPSLGMSVASETLDHYSMEAGAKVKDEQVTLDINRSLAFTTDNINPENVAAFIIGDDSTLTAAGGSVVGETINSVLQDRYYQLGASATNPTGAREVSAVTVKDDGIPTTFTVDVDYSLDATLGRIYIIAGGAITDGTNLVIDYTEAASTRDQIISTRDGSVEGAMRFVADNAAGPNKDYYFPYVKVTPNGEQTLKSDEWQQLAFSVEALELNSTTAQMYIDGRATV